MSIRKSRQSIFFREVKRVQQQPYFLRWVQALKLTAHIDELVRFASACSAIAISRFPLPLYPPTWKEVEELINQK